MPNLSASVRRATAADFARRGDRPTFEVVSPAGILLFRDVLTMPSVLPKIVAVSTPAVQLARRRKISQLSCSLMATVPMPFPLKASSVIQPESVITVTRPRPGVEAAIRAPD